MAAAASAATSSNMVTPHSAEPAVLQARTPLQALQAAVQAQAPQAAQLLRQLQTA